MESEIREMEHGEFREDWLKKHPASIPIEEVEDSPYPKWVKPGIFLGSAIASLLSGVHTMMVVYNGIPLSPMVDENMRQWVARGSFVVYEFGMFASAFLMSAESTRSLAKRILFVIFTTLIVTNLYSVLQTYGFDLQNDPTGSAVTALFSLVPFIAYGLGKFYVSILTNERALIRRSKEAFKEASRALDAIINREYNKHIRDVRKAIREAHSVNSLNEQPARVEYPLNSPNMSSGYTKQMNSREIIHEFFLKHPEFKNMTLDDLHKAIERETGVRVGRTSIHNVRNEWEQPGYTNGHSTQ